MEFNVKLQELRKRKGLTQEELSEKLFVSRTAISKWESGRGYPSIDSLKVIAKFFSVSIDELLSGNELLSIAEENNKQTKRHYKDLVFGLLDISVAMFFFLPFFAQKNGVDVEAVSLLSLTSTAFFSKVIYYVLTFAMIAFGVLTLVLQKCNKMFWVKSKEVISLVLNALAVLVFIISPHVYAAVFLFVFLVIKALILIKKQ